MIFSTVFACIMMDSDPDLAFLSIVGLGLRRLGIIFGNESRQKLLFHLGSVGVMVMGSTMLFFHALLLHLIKFNMIDCTSAMALLPFSGLFSGIGSVYVEEGLYSYFGFEDTKLEFENVDQYLASDMWKTRDLIAHAMRFF